MFLLGSVVSSLPSIARAFAQSCEEGRTYQYRRLTLREYLQATHLPATQTHVLEPMILFLQSTSLIWSLWLPNDSRVRLQYNIIARRDSSDLLEAMKQGTDAKEAAKAACIARNDGLIRQRSQTSPLGLLFPSIIKPNLLPFWYLERKYARELAGKDFRSCTPNEKITVQNITRPSVLPLSYVLTTIRSTKILLKNPEREIKQLTRHCLLYQPSAPRSIVLQPVRQWAASSQQRKKGPKPFQYRQNGLVAF